MQRRRERVDVGLARVEGAHPPHLTLRRIPVVEPEALPKPVRDGGRKNREDGVRLRLLRDRQSGQPDSPLTDFLMLSLSVAIASFGGSTAASFA